MEYEVDPEIVKAEIAKNLPKYFFEDKAKQKPGPVDKDKVLEPYVRPAAIDMYKMDLETEVGFEDLRSRVDLDTFVVEGLSVTVNAPDESIELQEVVGVSKRGHKLSGLKNISH
ncbi:unnamed protein product [Hydatigera taeniaeformis]|uniref:SHSP domain-containing protein n=1 Tax=Hydatigena taeniaeformis TaxID=6205 RepID=A0A0R3WKB3_HYDTA|nr:unnamed protein product [Hydatigera taeniaeformis]